MRLREREFDIQNGPEKKCVPPELCRGNPSTSLKAVESSVDSAAVVRCQNSRALVEIYVVSETISVIYREEEEKKRSVIHVHAYNLQVCDAVVELSLGTKKASTKVLF